MGLPLLLDYYIGKLIMFIHLFQFFISLFFLVIISYFEANSVALWEGESEIPQISLGKGEIKGWSRIWEQENLHFPPFNASLKKLHWIAKTKEKSENKNYLRCPF